MTFHCPRCSKQWEVADHVAAHFNYCTEQFTGESETTRRRGRIPADGPARGQFWHALLEQIGEDKTWRK